MCFNVLQDLVAFGFEQFNQFAQLKMSFRVMSKIIVHTNKEIFDFLYQPQRTQGLNSQVMCSVPCSAHHSNMEHISTLVV
jgi:hypothetical protein